MKKRKGKQQLLNKILRFVSKIDVEVAFLLLLFLYLQLVFLSTLPYLDGNIDFVKVFDYHAGGLEKLATTWGSVHPPLKPVLGSILISVFGPTPYAVTVLGFAHGLIGIVAMFLLAKKLFGRKTAILAACFLAAYPLFYANAVFSLIDFLIAVYLLGFLASYAHGKVIPAVFFLCLGVATKETFLLFAVIVIFIETVAMLLQFKSKKFKPRENRLAFLFLIPPLLFFLWTKVLQGYGNGIWGDWIFADTADKGAFYTIVNNLVSFKFINEFAVKAWLQLFLLNFNWLIWGFTAFGGIAYIWQAPEKAKKLLRASLAKLDQRGKTFMVIGLSITLYFVSVLSFQTYTIPRYALPLLCLLILFFARALSLFLSIKPFAGKILISFFVGIFSVALLTSSDPVSFNLWGEQIILGEKVYAINEHGAGNDGLTYNAQFMLISLRRSTLIYEANRDQTPISSPECRWLFADINNDIRIFDYLGLTGIPRDNLCIATN